MYWSCWSLIWFSRDLRYSSCFIYKYHQKSQTLLKAYSWRSCSFSISSWCLTTAAHSLKIPLFRNDRQIPLRIWIWSEVSANGIIHWVLVFIIIVVIKRPIYMLTSEIYCFQDLSKFLAVLILLLFCCLLDSIR